MNFYSIIINGYLLVAALLVYFVVRDRKNPNIFFGKHRRLSIILIVVLIIGALIAIDARYIEPNLVTTKDISIKISAPSWKKPIKIIFLADLQLGANKKADWAKKLAEKVMEQKPDIIIFGGDLIDNEGASEDESVYLEPLLAAIQKIPSYYIFGNHEYGLTFLEPTVTALNLGRNYKTPEIGAPYRAGLIYTNGDNTDWVIKRMEKFNIPLLRDDLNCLKIKKEALCLYGLDDIWGGKNDFSALKNRPADTPLILLSHNPDGILLWPKDQVKPDLVLSGHTHGGQVFLPFLGPVGQAEIKLDKKFYRGLNFYDNVPVYTSVGLGESGGPIRFLTLPEMTIIELTP